MREQDFYDRLADFFDVMTNWQGQAAYELPFITRLLGPAPRRVLDAACGTGQHSIALAKAGYDSTGADISSAMIERARAGAQAEGAAVSFSRRSFQELRNSVGGDFDAVLCLGNSLVHVLNEDDLLASLTAMVSCLRPGGLLLLHNLNYDKRMVDKPRWFQVNSGLLGRPGRPWSGASPTMASSSSPSTLPSSRRTTAVSGTSRCRVRRSAPGRATSFRSRCTRSGCARGYRCTATWPASRTLPRHRATWCLRRAAPDALAFRAITCYSTRQTSE